MQKPQRRFPFKRFIKSVRISLLLGIILLLSGNDIYAQIQRWHIKGQVLGETQQPLPAATISLIDKVNKEVVKTIADSSGRFKISYTEKGSYALLVTNTGYLPYKSDIFTLTDKDFETIKLTTLASDLKGVVVTQPVEKLVELDGGSIVYNVSKSITAQGGSALEALKQAPGIYVDNNNSITLNGRGGALILLPGDSRPAKIYARFRY